MTFSHDYCSLMEVNGHIGHASKQKHYYFFFNSYLYIALGLHDTAKNDSVVNELSCNLNYNMTL